MKNRDYWKERFLEEEERRHKDARAYLNTVEKQYNKVLRNIEKDITYWYERIAKNNNISLKEARELLSKKELEEFKWTVEEYIEKGRKNGINGQWTKQLENASARVHISRLESIKFQIQNEIEGLYGERLKSMDDYLTRVYGDTYYRSIYTIQKGFGVGSSFSKINTRKINEVIYKPWAADGKNFSDRIWEDKTKLINKLHNGITQNLIRGSKPDELIKEIQREFNVKKSVAQRLVMTETAAYSAKAEQKAYKEMGVDKYEIIATLDNKTSEICREMDGKVFDLKDYVIGVTAPVFHPNCRSTTAPYFEDDKGTRVARGEDGKTYHVPSDMKYQEWYDKYIKVDEKISYSDDEIRALNNYISPASIVLNEKLRNGDTLSDSEKEWIKNLDNALDKTPAFKGNLIRDVEIKDKNNLLKFLIEYKTGETVKCSQYISTSNKISYNEHANIRIFIPNSTKGKNISNLNKEETEVLYKRDCSFKVKDVKYDKGKFEIILEEVDE